jgi:beta-1,4-N-acetylglucosaminyltransferase
MAVNSLIILFLSLSFAAFVTLLLRLLWLLPSFRVQPRSSRKSSSKLVIVLGSGGHTAEMLRLIEPLNFDKYTRRVYVVSSGDTLSEGKARAFEIRKNGSEDENVL